MSNPTFIHLNVHSEYSLVDSLVRIKPLIKTTAAMGMPAVALTDYMNLFGAVKFYQAAMAAGVKPIIGAELAIHNPLDKHTPFRVLALCQNNQGYRHLCVLLSKAYQDGQSSGQALIEPEWLASLGEGLICIAGAASDVGVALIHEHMDLAKERLSFWKTHFPSRFYLEIQRIGALHEEKHIQQVITLAKSQTLPVVATQAVRFMAETDFEAHEARVCIHAGFTLDDPKRPKAYTPQQYLRDQAAMAALFADVPSALTNTIEIAKRCNVTLRLGEPCLPNFPIPETDTLDSYFTRVSHEGLQKRLQFLPALTDETASIARATQYQARLDEELQVILRMGFAGYFLIVADFIAWSKQQDIPVGPGRGSGAGSLVAFALGITDIDPIPYDLLFERFLNPERVSMPDFDVDFCMDGRDRVIEYVAEKYGRDAVSQIITYGTMAAKAVIRDVGRVLGHPYGFVDKLAKLVPFELGITLEKALAQEEELRKRYNTEEEVTSLIDLALKMEGITRNAGKHAGGVVIAPSQLTDFTALYCEQDSEQWVTQYDKDDVEAVGLVKFDFLGLRTLTIIHWAVQAINKRLQAEQKPLLDITLIPVDDAKTFELMKACETTAVFQLESRGMKDLIKRLQPDCFEEIIALVALFRPGPLQSGMVDDFINCKHGLAEIVYPHPKLETILKPTYGIILYQEQVMQIAQVLAGYTLGGADLLRRAMGKKKPEEMAKQRQIFVDGSVANGVAAELAGSIFDLMEKFAGYGFNKSHSAAYALIAYQTAWLKAHYPAEFMAAVASSDMDNTDKVQIFVDEIKRMRLPLLPPQINASFFAFTVNPQAEIVYGLGAIKGAGEAAIQVIIDEREAHGPYKDLFDFCQRVDLRKVNKRVLEGLVQSGALDTFGQDRGVLFHTLNQAVQLAELQDKNTSIGQSDLFGVSAPSIQTYANVAPWSMQQRLQEEKMSLGFYLSGHPIHAHMTEIESFCTGRINAIKQPSKHVIIAGFVSSLRTLMTKRGDRMAFIALDDDQGKMEIAVFADIFADTKELLESEQLLIVEGEASLDDYSGNLRMTAKRILPMDMARMIYAKALTLNITENWFTLERLPLLKLTLSKLPRGNLPVVVHYQRNNAVIPLTLGSSWRIKPTDEALHTLNAMFDFNAASYSYPPRS